MGFFDRYFTPLILRTRAIRPLILPSETRWPVVVDGSSLNRFFACVVVPTAQDLYTLNVSGSRNIAHFVKDVGRTVTECSSEAVAVRPIAPVLYALTNSIVTLLWINEVNNQIPWQDTEANRIMDDFDRWVSLLRSIDWMSVEPPPDASSGLILMELQRLKDWVFYTERERDEKIRRCALYRFTTDPSRLECLREISVACPPSLLTGIVRSEKIDEDACERFLVEFLDGIQDFFGGKKMYAILIPTAALGKKCYCVDRLARLGDGTVCLVIAVQ